MIAVCERSAIVTVGTVNPRRFAHVRPRHMAALAAVPQDPLAVCDGHRRCAVKGLPEHRFRPCFPSRNDAASGLTATENKQTAASGAQHADLSGRDTKATAHGR